MAGDPESIYYPKGRQQQERPESVCRAAMMRTATHKLVWRTSGEHELYDLVVDREELKNVIGKEGYAEVQRELERRMLDWYVHTADVVPFEPDPRGFPSGLVS